MAETPKTPEELIKLQDDLIKGYISGPFQRKCWAALDGVSDELEKAQKRAELCSTVQYPVMEKYGFEGSRAGVSESMKSFTPELNAFPPIALRNNVMQYLIDPKAQQKQANTFGSFQEPPPGIPLALLGKPNPDEWDVEQHKVWIVKGGKDSGGIMVRKSEDVKSQQLDKRLSTGAIIEELEKEGERLKYQRLTGEGPDIGWVSIGFKGKLIIEPLWFTPTDEDIALKDKPPEKKEAASKEPKDKYKVVHDRVVKRATPSKDAKMMGMEKKDAIVSGVVEEVDGVPWLKVRTKGVEKMETAYIMIDGKSVGLGALMEKV